MDSSQKIFALVYTSKTSEPITDELVADILASSYRNNLRDGISGFFISRSYEFFQYLEGPEEKVRNLFKRIANDSRHTDVELQGTATMDQRLMPRWSMAHVEEDIVDLFEAVNPARKRPGPEELIALLKEFSSNAKMLNEISK